MSHKKKTRCKSESVKKLTEVEFHKLEHALNKIELHKERMLTKQLEIQKNMLEQEIMQLKFENLRRRHDQLVDEGKALIGGAKENDKIREPIVESIKDRLGIDGQFGYDEDALEILRED